MTLTEIRGKHVIATVESDKGLKPLDISNFLDAYDRVVEEVILDDHYVRGDIVHLKGDHEVVSLGQTWHLVRKNQVDMQRIGKPVD